MTETGVWGSLSHDSISWFHSSKSVNNVVKNRRKKNSQHQIGMSEQPADDATSPQQPGKENSSRGDGGGEEKTVLQAAEEMSFKDNICREEQPEVQESPAKGG